MSDTMSGVLVTMTLVPRSFFSATLVFIGSHYCPVIELDKIVKPL